MALWWLRQALRSDQWRLRLTVQRDKAVLLGSVQVSFLAADAVGGKEARKAACADLHAVPGQVAAQLAREDRRLSPASGQDQAGLRLDAMRVAVAPIGLGATYPSRRTRAA